MRSRVDGLVARIGVAEVRKRKKSGHKEGKTKDERQNETHKDNTSGRPFYASSSNNCTLNMSSLQAASPQRLCCPC